MHGSLVLDDTIAALASAPGPAARGIVRVSGADVRKVVSAIFAPVDAGRWRTARQAWQHPGAVRLSGVQLPLEANVLLWPSSRSYTGEPLAEVHVIGSPPLLEALLAAMFENGARPAQRGEFTLRAFLTGRIDLLQAEAVLGVIDATDQLQLNVALGQLGGGLSRRIAALHEAMLLHLADLEAGLDFVDEGIDFVSRDELRRRLAEATDWLGELSAHSKSRLHSTGRRHVVLAGLPNAGKSTLFNALVGDERAIVSEIPGTTRDYLSAALDWNGQVLELIDTAGWDNGSTGIAHSAGAFRQEQWDRADLVVWCTACDASPVERSINVAQREVLARSGALLLSVRTKSDLRLNGTANDDLPVSAVTRAGLEQLRAAIGAQLQNLSADGSLLGSTSARCRESLAGARDAMQRALKAAETGVGDELIAVELREAIDQLGKIAGRVYTDDVLDRIFSRFCIGK